MSEIKGQLLGVILVLSLFAIVSGALTKVAEDYKKHIQTEATEIITPEDSI